MWTSIAPHTTPGSPEPMEPKIALVTGGVETDVWASATRTWARA
ncbi:MAG TPA: hypothetical protein VMV92_19940 [Streptosporangiaceae bacterium]|nr:hypothetical protein [Streptosporangiaceae bacterium]